MSLYFSAVFLCSKYFIVIKKFLSPFSHVIITCVVRFTLYDIDWVCVYIFLLFIWSGLFKALYCPMLGWPLCKFAAVLVSVNSSTVNIKIWTTELCYSELVSPAMPQGFPAMREAITITLQSDSWICSNLHALPLWACAGVTIVGCIFGAMLGETGSVLCFLFRSVDMWLGYIFIFSNKNSSTIPSTLPWDKIKVTEWLIVFRV